MKNSLVLIDSSTSMIAIPGDRIRYIVCTGTDIQINYNAEDDAEGSANITVTSGKGDEVLKELGRVLTETTGSFVVADDVNSTYMPNVTAVAGITPNA